MELGTGIFLGATAIALVYLYTQTYERWNWKKIILWPITLGVIAVSGFLGLIWWEDRPKPEPEIEIARVEEFWGLQIGTTKSDVLFFKGEPEQRSEIDEDADYFHYPHQSDASYLVFFDKGVVVGVLAFESDSSFENASLLGVSFQDNSTSLVNKVGEPTEIEMGQDGRIRVFKYPNLNINYILTENKVTSLGFGKQFWVIRGD